jgi:hypothetical protein
MGAENPSSTDSLNVRYRNNEIDGIPLTVQNDCTINLESVADANGEPKSPHENPTIALKIGDVIELESDHRTKGAKMVINGKQTVWVTPFELRHIIAKES